MKRRHFSKKQGWPSHRKFVRFIRKKLRKHYGSPEARKFLAHYAPLIVKIILLNLDKASHILKAQYSSSKKGKKRRDPVSMLRSLLVMTLVRETSITKWVALMKATPLFAILSGFNPDDVPGVGAPTKWVVFMISSKSSTLKRINPSLAKMG